jgi:hypothetical protein
VTYRYRHARGTKNTLVTGLERHDGNFTKFLVASDGTVLKRYAPNDKPEAIGVGVSEAVAEKRKPLKRSRLITAFARAPQFAIPPKSSRRQTGGRGCRYR